jgi:tripartite-type tricarboxylate transporter receptor subunit TctC
VRYARANPGKLKALGVTVEDRITALPDVPALSDAPELKGFHVTTSIGLFVPANTPTAITERLNKELNDILASPDLRRTFEDQAARVGKGSGAEFAEFLRRELVRNAAVIKAANIKAE